MLYDDYIEYYKKYKKVYGEKTVILMEVGSFFELYAENEETTNISEICSILNIQSTRKNKSILESSRSNPIMAGFPSHSLKKFIDILLHEQYTIVLVEQVTPPPNPERKVTQVLSPATYMEPGSSFSSNYLMCFYICKGYKSLESFYCLSISFMDVTTGETFYFSQEIKGDHMTIIQEMSRIITSYTPKELVIISDEKDLIINLNFNYHNHISVNLKIFQTVSYQNTVLKKVYPETGLLSPIEYIDLEKNCDMLTSFIYLINFAYEHNELIIKKLQKPTVIQIDSHLRLTNLSAEHLNILPRQGCQSSILQLLNTCDTSIGRRYFKECLICPLVNVDEIEERYKLTEYMIELDFYKKIRPYLQSIKDLERLFRRLSLTILHPSEMIQIDTSLKSVQCIQEIVKDIIEVQSVIPFMNEYTSKWDMEKMSTGNINFYKSGVHSDLDRLSNKIDELHSYFQKIVDNANKADQFFKLEVTSERQDYQIIITKKRYETYCERLKTTSLFTSQPLSASNKTVLKVTFQGMREKQEELHSLTAELKLLVKDQYIKELESFDIYQEMMGDIVTFIKYVDFHVTCAKNAINYNYTKPTINNSNKSFICAKKIRHPLIEIFQTDIPYIPNDVDLNESGILLYGINSAGKSSYMKSVGVNLIMAQAGMFVASESFEYSPYDKIFTRIPGGDNLFKGQSTFVAEICELRSILKYSTNRSLIIGDELASGTESISAISIVAAGIKTLSERKSSFIFATHLHEIANLETIKLLTNVFVFHISIMYDDERKLLIYDRILKPGSGETMYGLEVCKSLDMPYDFLHMANMIRQEYLGLSKNIVDMKKSRYSSDVFVDICSICGNKAEEVHHIKEQKLANKKGFIGNIHKNDKHNLMGICEKCHDNIHTGKISIDGYQKTNKGVKLMINNK